MRCGLIVESDSFVLLPKDMTAAFSTTDGGSKNVPSKGLTLGRNSLLKTPALN
jgi:hypothetical protein